MLLSDICWCYCVMYVDILLCNVWMSLNYVCYCVMYVAVTVWCVSVTVWCLDVTVWYMLMLLWDVCWCCCGMYVVAVGCMLLYVVAVGCMLLLWDVCCCCVTYVDVAVGCMLLLWDVCCCCVMYVVAVWHMLMLLCDVCCCCVMYVVAVWCMLLLWDVCCCCGMYVVAAGCMLMLLCDVLMLQGYNVVTAGTDSHRLIEMARDRALTFLPDLHLREQFVQHLKLQSITQYVSSVCLWLCVHAGFVCGVCVLTMKHRSIKYYVWSSQSGDVFLCMFMWDAPVVHQK